MARMPGAVWRPIPVSSTRPRRRTGRGICLHVAVSESSSLFGFFSTAEVDSHFYVAKDGTIEQYVDTALVAYANRDGNATLISVETQGGVTNTDTEPWTEAQVASLARLCAWSAESDGFPLQPMPNSLSTSRGVGYHKLGVDPYRVSGGEQWSSSYGKVCPGAGKIAQVSQVIERARQIAGEVTPEDDMAAVPQAEWDAVKKAVDALLAKFTDNTINGGTLHTAVRDMHTNLVQKKYDRPDGEGLEAVTLPSLVRYDEANTRRVLAEVAALPDAIKAAVREALGDSVVKVDVSVSDGDTPPVA